MDKRELARQRYLEGRKYKDISAELDVPLNTLKSWRTRDKWGKKDAPEKMHLKKVGAPKNNKNAVGNSGGAAPKGNKNAVGNSGGPPPRNKNALTTGEYETIYDDFLSEDEKQIMQNSADPFSILENEISLLQIRQKRMMKRIVDTEAGLNTTALEKLHELRGRKQLIEMPYGGKKVQIEVPDLVVTEIKETEYRKITDILSIEDALTRITNQLVKAIKQLDALRLNQTKDQLMKAQAEKMNVEVEALKGGNDDKPIEIVIKRKQ